MKARWKTPLWLELAQRFSMVVEKTEFSCQQWGARVRTRVGTLAAKVGGRGGKGRIK